MLKTSNFALFTQVALLLLILGMVTQANAASEKLALNKNGIKVWTYPEKNSSIMRYRAETILDTSLENAVGLILDTQKGSQWIPFVNQLKIIEQNRQTGKFIIYMRLDFPFPLKDRDVVVEGRLYKENANKIFFKNTAVLDTRVPIYNDIVRIMHYKGDWLFEKLPNQKIKVTTSGYADPAGAIPLSFVNSFVQQQPYQMLQKMKQRVQQSNYTSTVLPEVLQ